MDNANGCASVKEVFDPLALPLMAVLAYVSLVPYPFMGTVGIGGVPVLRLLPFCFGLLVLSVFLYRRLASGAGPVGMPYLTWPVLALLGVEFLGSMGSVEPVKSLVKVCFYTITGLSFFFAASSLDGRSARSLLRVILVTSFLVGAVSVFEYFTGRVPFYYEDYVLNNPYLFDPDLVGRSFSTIGHPVFLGAFFVLTIPVGLHLFRTEQKRYMRGVALLCIAGAALGLFFSFSRGAYLAALLSVFVFYRGKKAAIAAIVALVIALGFIAVSSKVRDTIVKRNPYHDYVDKFKSAHRVKAFELTARVMGDAPVLGVGVGNYRHLYERYRASGDDTRKVFATPDNMYLVTLAESGLLGLGLFLYILSGAYSAFSDGYRRDGSRFMLLAGMSALAGFAVDAFFFDALYVEPVRVVFWTIMGLSAREL